jgi:hypothetical protein
MKRIAQTLTLLASFFAATTAFGTALSGTYTINAGAAASATNFKNIISAIAYMTGTGSRTDGGPANSAPFGVSGPVVFNIASGTYSEIISIAAVTGSSPVNTITFQSASGVAADVTITFPGTSNTYNFTLNATQYFTFKNLGFLSGTTSNYRGAINMLTTCRGITVSGCVFNSGLNNTRGNHFVYSIGTKGMTLDNNTFNGYPKHFESQGDSADMIRNNSFTGNGSSNSVLLLGSLASGRILNNNFNNTDATAVDMIGGVVIDTFVISGNKFAHRGQYTVSISNKPFAADKPCYIQNNFFGNVTREALYLYYTSYTYVFHNSFYAPAATANVRMITFIEPGETSVKNNIYIVKGSVPNGGLIYYVPYNNATSISDNLYYYSDTSLNAAVRQRDALAKFQDVAFTSSTDLHIQNACLKTTRIPYVSTDIDGENRGASLASYGADEVLAIGNDAGFTMVTAPVSPVVTTGSAISFSARVKNYGSNTITSLEAAYSVNGGAPVTQTFNGLSIGSCDSALISFSVPYTVGSEQTAVSVYPLLTNGVAETRTSGDTAVATYYTAMSGTYSVNPAGSGVRNFRRFTEADSALVVRGVNGAVIFDMYPGTYAGDTLRAVGGISAINNIVIRSYTNDTSSVIISGKMTIAEGAGFYTFRGLKFTGATGTFDGAGSGQVSILRNAHDVVVENCSFITTAVPVCSFGCSAERAYALRSLNADSSIIIRNNKIWGTVFIESAIENPGGTPRPAIATKGVVVTGNRVGSGRGYIFTSYTVYGINVDGAPAAIIDSNFVQDDQVFVRSSGAFRVTRNRIFDLNHLSFQSYIGFIGNLYAYSNTTGLVVIGNGNAAARALVANNMIHIKESGGNGLNVNGDFIDIVYNSINDRSDVASQGGNIYNTTGPSVAATVAGSNTIFKNNIISGIHTAGTAYKGQLIASTLAAADIDYNGYYTTESTKNFATMTVGNSSTFATWQSAGNDAHSVFAHPKFRSDTLLRPNQNVFNGAGTAIVTVVLDFENEERHATNPDLGADEFTLPSADAGVQAYIGPNRIFASGVTPVQLTIKNYGTSNLTGVTVNWKVNGVLQTPYAWTGVINYDSTSAPVTIGSFNFPGGRIHNLQFWTTAPNGATDPVAVNDTLYQLNVVAALNGIYTIGGTSPDFINCAAATTALQLGGITGPVTFNLRDGIYTEAVQLREVAGASTANRIIFQSESNDSTKVTITQASVSGSAVQNTVTIDGADFMTLRKLTLQQTSGFGTAAVKVKNGANNILVENCLLRANLNNNSPKMLVDSAGIDSNLVIRSNRFLFGDLQIDIDGNPFVSGPGQPGLQIIGNRFDSMTGRSVVVNGVRDMELSGNSTRYGGNSTPSAYFCTNVSGNTAITGNTAYGKFQYGIYLVNSNVNAGDTVRIVNNMIGLGAVTATAYPIYLSNSPAVSVYHNTANTSGTGSCIYFASATRITVMNNIFHHYGTGTAYNIGDFTPDPTLVINNNNAFTNGANIGRVFSTNQTWAQWQAAGRDAAGTNLRPVYIDSLSNLHINRAYANLNNTGTAVAVATDFDGELRNAVSPDMGADEYKPYDNDAALTRFTSPVTPFNAGATDIRVTVRNFGQMTLATAQVNYTINGVAQPAFSFAGSVPYGDSAVNVLIGNYISVGGRTDTIKVWVSAPNGSADEFAGNDTLLGYFTPALCGTFTIGGTTPDYATMQDASDALSRGGVSCPVVFNIRNGEYSGRTQFAAIPGASAVNTVTFQSESGDSSLAIISMPYDFNFNGYMVRFKGASYITFKKLSFVRRVFSFYTQGFASAIFLMDSLSARHITVTNCYLKSFGSSMTAATITNAGGSFTLDNSYIDSTMTVNVTAARFNFRNNHMRFGGVTTTADSVFIQNNIVDTLSSINCGNSSSLAGRIFIQNNQLRNNTSGANNIQVGSTAGGDISGNKIENSSFTGININTGSNPTLASPVRIYNNFIHVKNASAGIQLNGTSNVYLVHNSINVTGASTSSLGIGISGGSGNTVLNNNVANQAGGVAINLTNVSAIKDLNYNNYYVTGTNLGNYNGSNRATLALWQAATAKDAQSKNITPGFISSTDLHTLQTALDSAGTIAQYNPGSGYVQMVGVDIDGELRNAVKPDIGADEISLIGNDAGVVLITEPFGGPLQPALAGKPVKLRIKNYGSSAVATATVNWTVNGVAQAPYSFSGNILSQDTSAPVTIGTMNFLVGSSYTVKAWTTNVNGGVDGNTLNDTTTVSNVYPALCGTYTIGGSTPDFPNFRSALNELNNGGVLCAVTLNVRNGVYNDSALVFGVVPGRSAANSVLVKSESGDSTTVVLQSLGSSDPTLYTNANMAAVIFDKAQYITIQGITMRFTNNPVGGSPEALVLFRNNGSKNISILNSVLENRNTNNRTPGAAIGSTGAGSIDSNIVIRNNWLRKVGGIMLRSDPDNSSVFSPLLNMPGIVIEGNKIDTAGIGSGVLLKNALLPVIKNNAIAQGLVSVRYSSAPQIIGNKIAVTNETSGGTIGNGINVTNLTNTAAAHALVANNFVSVADMDPANANVPNGIWASGVDYLDVVHNNVLLRHTIRSATCCSATATMCGR